MKKLYPFLLVLTLPLTTLSQIPKNSILLGGHLGFHNSFNDIDNLSDNKSQSLSIGIVSGKAIKENKILGLDISFNHSSSVTNIPPNEKYTRTTNGFTFGPFYRIYKPLLNKFYLFGQANVSFGISSEVSNYEIANLDSKTRTIGGNASVTPGATYQILKSLHVELFIPSILSLGYQEFKYEFDDPGLSNSAGRSYYFNTRFNNYSVLNSIGFGFQFIF